MDKLDPKANAEGEQIDVVDDPVKDDADVGVTVNLDNPQQKKSEPIQDKTDDRILKMERRLEYQARQFEKGIRQMNEMVQNMSANRTVQTQTQPGRSTVDEDDLDKIAEQDWKKAVEILADRRAKKIIEEQENVRKQKEQQATVQDELAKSKARVLKECPEIEDESSMEAQTYIQVINEDPKLLSNPRGPELAMYRMRDLLARKTPETSDSIEKEIARRTRVASAYVAPGTRPSSNQIVLTKSEQQYCDSHKIPYDQYAKMKSYDQTRLKEGVDAE